MTTSPMHLDRFQAGLYSAISALLPTATVVWSPSEYPADDVPLLVAIRVLTGPDFAPGGTKAKATRTLPTAGMWTVGAVSSGQTIVARASGLQWEYAVQTGDSTEDARDGLLAAIDDTLVDATFAASSTNAIAVTATALGDLWNMGAAGSVTWAATSSSVAQCLLGDVTATVEIQIFSQSRYLRNGAQFAAGSLLTRLRLQTARDILCRHGLSIHGEPSTVNLDSLSGPGWQSRTAITMRVGTTALAAEAIDTIEVVDLDLTVKDPESLVEVDL